MLSAIWNQFLTIVRQEVGSQVVETWLKAVSLHQWDSLQKTAYLIAPNNFVKEWVKNHYHHLLEVHLGRLFNVEHPKIVILEATSRSKPEPSKQVSIIPAHAIYDKNTNSKSLIRVNHHKFKSHLNKNYSFDTFVKGPNNQMAYAAALAITQKLGKLYNPLFIYGCSGLGKTHLLHAIAHEVKSKYEGIEILYQSADRFVNEFINAIRFDKIHRFQAKYKNIDLFLVDDIQCISNKEQTQEAFFHIFNAMYDAHKQIVFSSDAYPADIDGLAERLRSRLSWGLVADIQVPTIETKIAIIKRKAELHQQDISDEVATFIASQHIANVRELEGALVRVLASASLMKQPVSLDVAKKVLYRNERKVEKQVINFERIMKVIQKKYSYNLTDLRSKNRSKQLALARHVAMYLMKRHTDKSLHEIALYLARHDHSTVIHAFKQIQQKLMHDEDFSRSIQHMEQELSFK